MNGNGKGPVTDGTGKIIRASDAAASIEGLFNDPANKRLLALAVPKHLSVDRLLRVAVVSIRRTPALLACDKVSLLGCVVQASQLGLEVGGALGHAYLVPYKKEATLILGYKGLMDLARRSGQVSTIEAVSVVEGDTFHYERGLTPVLKHVPCGPSREDPTKVIGVYAILRLRDGGVQFEAMTRDEVEAVRARSMARNSGPWVTDWTAMALKTVLRRLLKFAPVSVEVQRAVALDEEADAGIPQSLDVGPLNVTPPPEKPDRSAAPTQPPGPPPSDEAPPPDDNDAPPQGSDERAAPGECPAGPDRSLAVECVAAGMAGGRQGIAEWFEVQAPNLSDLPAEVLSTWRVARLCLLGARTIAPFRAAGLKTYEKASAGLIARYEENPAFGEQHVERHAPDWPAASTPAGWCVRATHAAVVAAYGK